jgi:hypothetical protein
MFEVVLGEWGVTMETNEVTSTSDSQGIGRRKFLANAGKFAAVTPPAVAMLMSTSLEASAFTGSVTGPGRHHPKGPKGGKGRGKGHGKGRDKGRGRGRGRD